MENLKLNKSNSPVLISILLFLFFVSVSIVFYQITADSIFKNSENVFSGEVSRADKNFSDYIVFYGNILGSIKGFFESSQAVEPEEFKSFIEDILVSGNNDPISALSYVEKVKRGDLESFLKVSTSLQGDPAGFDSQNGISTFDPDKEEYYLLKYSEVRESSNENLFGKDFSDIYSKEFENAIKTGDFAATAVFVNPYSNKNEIMFFKPVFKGDNSQVDIKDDITNVSGFVVLTLKTKDLLNNIFSPGSSSRLLATDVFEGAEMGSGALIYSNSIYPSGYLSEHIIIKKVQAGGRDWTIKFSSTPQFKEAVAQKSVPFYIILSGFFVSLAISFITYFILISRNRAIKLAEVMTLDLASSEKRLERINRALLTINEANETIIKGRDEQKLLDGVCNILIKSAGYRLVWIGYAQSDEEKNVRVAAWAGHSDGYIEKLRVSWSENDSRGQGPVGRAMRSGLSVIDSDFDNDPDFEPWREDAKKRGYRSGIFIPLRADNRQLGSINIYSSEKNIFSEEEVALLQRFTNNVAYSILSIRTFIEKDIAEKSLKDSEEILSQYVLNSPIYTFIKEVTPSGSRVIKASENYADMIGLAGKEMEGKKMEELFPPEFAKKIIADDLAVIASGKVLKVDEDLNGKNYTTIKFPIIIGKKKLLAGYTIDITDRKKTELDIRQSEEKFSKAFNGSPYANALTALDDGSVVDINSSFTSVFGYSKDEVVGKTTVELGIWVNLEDRKRMIDAIEKQGVVKNLKVSLRRKSGEIMRALLSVQLINIGDNKYIYSVVSDITEQEKIREELVQKMEELEQFRLAVDNASDHIIITDPNSKIIYANRGVEKITGYSMKELIGSTPALWGKQMPKEFYEKMWHTIKVDKQPFVGELTNKRKSGQQYQAEFSVSPILNEAGEIIYFVGVERDITKAKEVERSKNEFVSLASHQLRTPLTAINWYAEMLLNGDVGVLGAKQKDYVGELYGSSKRMTDLVSALLNVSRIDLGTFTINPKPTDIVEISKGVIKDLIVRIKKKKLKIVEKYEKLPEINADPNLVVILLQNLVSNAVKYTQELGTITISIAKENSDVAITVKDNGYGIPMSQQDRIFQKFFRADNIIPVETDGNGLGLYMVKHILDNAGGSISFVSKEGEGTTFTVKIPASGMREREGTRILEQKGFGV